MDLKSLTFAAMLMVVAAPASAQTADPRAMIRLVEPGRAPIAATIEDLAWLEGSWTGDMAGIAVEHVILESAYGQMPTFVRALGGTEIVFYEIAVFTEAEDSHPRARRLGGAGRLRGPAVAHARRGNAVLRRDHL